MWLTSGGVAVAVTGVFVAVEVTVFTGVLVAVGVEVFVDTKVFVAVGVSVASPQFVTFVPVILRGFTGTPFESSRAST